MYFSYEKEENERKEKKMLDSVRDRNRSGRRVCAEFTKFSGNIRLQLVQHMTDHDCQLCGIVYGFTTSV